MDTASCHQSPFSNCNHDYTKTGVVPTKQTQPETQTRSLGAPHAHGAAEGVTGHPHMLTAAWWPPPSLPMHPPTAVQSPQNVQSNFSRRDFPFQKLIPRVLFLRQISEKPKPAVLPKGTIAVHMHSGRYMGDTLTPVPNCDPGSF